MTFANLRRKLGHVRRRIPRKSGPAILMYHRVADETFDPWGMAVSPGHFADHAAWLARNRPVLELTEFVRAQAERRLPANAIAITFDDGYACTFTTAAPLLETAGLPATVFVPAAAVQERGEFWWDELQQLVLDFDGPELCLDGRRVALGARSSRDRQWRPYDPARTDRQRAFQRLWSTIRSRTGQEVERAMAELRHQTGQAPSSRKSHRVSTPGELKSRPTTLEVGCHGLTHASLPVLGRAEQVREIEAGRTMLADLTGKAPATFAFPFGDADRETRALVEEAGFLCACDSRQKFVSRRDHAFALPRLAVGNWDAKRLERLLAGR